ncbi:hypothetical protein BD410DRAFT_253884 [Rickenella mellea]|uniref:Histone deacetylase complex subunit SAP30 Sin3 binding domain-containing protein n=1 Tax=Rickenella mellea TaxID=50990 RepID=A0A4Y7QNH1_9AGAM|nr:hypothetical protein BD410DRAFT_253884 [Rickenella mellea]
MNIAGQSTFSTTVASAPARPRPQARRKPVDDGLYGEVTSGGKRAAHERAEGEPRVKRKRVEHVSNASVYLQTGLQAQQNGENASPSSPSSSLTPTAIGEQVQFDALPTAALYRYMIHYDLVPPIYPSPLSAEDPPAPSALLEQMGSRGASPAASGPMATPANRPRRGPRESNLKDNSRRRSSRLVSEEMRGQVAVLSDVGEVHKVLASIAGRHFRTCGGVKEVDTLAGFMCAVKGRR